MTELKSTEPASLEPVDTEVVGSPDARRSSSDEQPSMSWGDRFRWVFWRHLTFGGLIGALVLFCVSATPSLLPRAAMLQGVVGGVAVVIGYGLGSGASSLLRKVAREEPSAHTKRVAWCVLLGSSIVLVPLFLWLGRRWQQAVRELMEMDSQAEWKVPIILGIAVAVAYLILVISRLVRALGRGLVYVIDRFAPRVVSVGVGAGLTVVIAVGLLQGFLFDPLLSALNETFSLVNDGTTDGVARPSNPERSGSPDSLIGWDTLGVKGRDFIGSGPTRADIEAFTGREAMEPIRVYGGLQSADSTGERVELAMGELDRTAAWDRAVLVVFTTTGTGWVDKRAADPLEYMHDGDTALVALQYSYLPSWVSFLVDQSKAAETGRAMIDAVHERWSAMPEDSRPRLLLFGESLGSFGTESAFDDVDDMVESIDGGLLVGPVFQNDIHSALTDDRDDDSPFWRPDYTNGENVRFVVAPPDLDQPDAFWGDTRIVYLQNSSDPITYWRPDLIWSPPEWLDDPRGPDVSEEMFWLPITTFLQTAADMAFSTGVPAGHGHVYGANPADAWAAIYPPVGWTPVDTERLRGLIGHEK